MEKSELNILGRLNIDKLNILKNEAESCIQNQLDSETIILNKANNLFQLLVVMLVSIIGYFVNQINMPKNEVLRLCSLTMSIFLLISIALLVIVIWPRSIRSKGTMPYKLLNHEIFDGSEKEIDRVLKNRIYCLNQDIASNIDTQNTRILFYKLSIISLFVGIATIFSYFLFL